MSFPIAQKFLCKNVYLKPINTDLKITNGLDSENVYTIPIAHGEGNYYADSSTIDELESNNQIIFRYCDELGNVTKESNPNGSLNNIAGICNKGKNVFGMMPHPERAAAALLGNTDGYVVLKSLINSVLETVA